ncbi:hypothetical protein ES288_A10G147500v1 [Gossypium darwinii]|uniref:Uncharacterized protein n=1 Tax=Gossypium darwinii TaxID=34276 RepID=A0A5D2EYQ9_GOSDA|nr:hypothetical protein ES288_A10G147500v1 [Gossypium darwinii]
MPKLSIRNQRRSSYGDSVFLLFSCSNRRSWRREWTWASNELVGGRAWCADVCGGEALNVGVAAWVT